MGLKLFFLFWLGAVCAANLRQMVRYFETLDSFNLQVVTRKKRNSNGVISSSKHISFETLGKKFNMVLIPGSSVIGPDFKATAVERDGRKQPVFVDPNNFYSGFLEDDRTVEIDAHFEDEILSASVHYPNETYVVEPAWRHRLASTNATMIAYRSSDVNWDEILPIDPITGKRTRMKDGIRQSDKCLNTTGGESTNEPNATKENGKPRHKRAVRRNICPLLTVADFNFFRDMGDSKRGITAAYIISTLQKVNRYFKRTAWDHENVNMGFHIRKIIIHTAFTPNDPNHYNANRDWDSKTMIKAFTESINMEEFCLGHLFTSYSFLNNVLGLAYTAAAEFNIPGGICSFADRNQVYLRTGFSTTKNARGEQVVSLQYYLVLAHELGHNWGALHDPFTPECSPDTKHHGKYIMWSVSVPGYEKNNEYFSPCSKRSISAVLKSKSAICFTVETQLAGLCGNGIVEMNEQCDPGVFEDGAEDACCTEKCQLRNGASCSDLNHECCKDCQVANTSVKCNERNELACKDSSFCDGRSLECPQPPNLPDNTSCVDRGLCFNGECLNFCVILGRERGKNMKPCLCSQNVTAMCRRCCSIHPEEDFDPNEHGNCLPTLELLEAGHTCFFGYCDETGSCIKVEKSSIMQIFSFIQELNISKLAQFMLRNIVGTVIVLSLIIWIPGSLLTTFKDKRLSKAARRRSVEECLPEWENHTRIFEDCQ